MSEPFIPKFRVGIGQDSHRFLEAMGTKPCVIGGVVFPDVPGLDADSDGDVVYHALCNAITSISHVPILGKVAIEMCHNDKITDSRIYLEKALETLGFFEIVHVAFTLEGARPRLQKKIDLIRANVASVLQVDLTSIGMTVTSGDGLTSFGRGEGLQCFCNLTVMSKK